MRLVTIYVATAVGSLLLLALDIWPGVIGFVLLCPFFCCATLPLLWVAGAVCIGWMVVCIGLVLLDVPRAVALWFHRDQFAALAATAPVEYGGADFNQWVDIFYVHSYAADGAGGVYFVTVQHPDGIGPDAMSYGFAIRPQRQECPFGMSSYRASWLFGEWYSFAVSDD